MLISIASVDYRNVQRTNLQPLVEDDLLPLQPNVLGPLDESGQVSLGGEVSTCKERTFRLESKRQTHGTRRTNSERPRLLLEQRVLSRLLGLSSSGV
jgi:hypothetical protein